MSSTFETVSWDSLSLDPKTKWFRLFHRTDEPLLSFYVRSFVLFIISWKRSTYNNFILGVFCSSVYSEGMLIGHPWSDMTILPCLCYL